MPRSLSLSLTGSRAHMALNGSHGLALGGRLPDARTGMTEMELHCAPGVPRRSPLGERAPRAQSQLHSTTESLGQRGQLRGVEQEGCPAQRPLTYTKNPFRVIGWQGSSQTFFFKGLCTEYKSSGFTGLSHKLAPDTKTVIQNGGLSSRVVGVQASR